MRGGKRRSPKGGGMTSMTCHICGREYGSRSLGIHLKQCEKLWVQREQLKPRAERRPVPRAPSTLAAVLDGNLSQSMLRKHRDEAFRKYNDDALVACEHCGRTFLPEKLRRHQVGCHADSPMKSVRANVAEQQIARKRAQRSRGAAVEAYTAPPSERASSASPPSSRSPSRSPAAAPAPAPAMLRPPPAQAAPAGYLGAGAIPLIEAHVHELESTLGDHARTMRKMERQLLELKNLLATLRERAATAPPPVSPPR